MTFDPTSVEVTSETLPKDNSVQVPWEYINVCRYSDQFWKTYHILHTYYIQNEWPHSLFLNKVQARQKHTFFLSNCLVIKYLEVCFTNWWSFLLCLLVINISWGWQDSNNSKDGIITIENCMFPYQIQQSLVVLSSLGWITILLFTHMQS